MSTPSPLVPKGSLLEEKSKTRPHLRIGLFIVAIHVVFLGGLLIQGCNPKQTPTDQASATNDLKLPPLDQMVLTNTALGDPTNALGTGASNVAVAPLPGSAPIGGGLPPIDPAHTTAVQPLPPQPNYGVGTAGSTGGADSAVATTTTQTAPVSAGGTGEYVVAKGDSFALIGKKFGVSAGAIAKANPGVQPTKLKVGQKLVIPEGATPAAASVAPATAAPAGGAAHAKPASSDVAIHVVKGGDTVTKIAKAHGVTVKAVRAANNLKTDRITVGQKIKIPARKEKPAPKEPAMSAEPVGGTTQLAPFPATAPAGGSVPAQPAGGVR